MNSAGRVLLARMPPTVPARLRVPRRRHGRRILANSTRPAEFIYDNLMIDATIVQASRTTNVTRLLYLGSSCIYPRDCPQPTSARSTWSGPLEPTNDAYAIANRGIRTVMRTLGSTAATSSARNVGPISTRGTFSISPARHVPALMRKFHDAKLKTALATVWGTGTPRREFLHVDDLADACLYLMEHYDGDEHERLGTRESLHPRAGRMSRDIVARCHIAFDTSKPDGWRASCSSSPAAWRPARAPGRPRVRL